MTIQESLTEFERVYNRTKQNLSMGGTSLAYAALNQMRLNVFKALLDARRLHALAGLTLPVDVNPKAKQVLDVINGLMDERLPAEQKKVFWETFKKGVADDLIKAAGKMFSLPGFLGKIKWPLIGVIVLVLLVLLYKLYKR